MLFLLLNVQEINRDHKASNQASFF